jgi:hypothetical protein
VARFEGKFAWRPSPASAGRSAAVFTDAACESKPKNVDFGNACAITIVEAPARAMACSGGSRNVPSMCSM